MELYREIKLMTTEDTLKNYLIYCDKTGQWDCSLKV